jgi:hypothetical protein
MKPSSIVISAMHSGRGWQDATEQLIASRARSATRRFALARRRSTGA